METVVALSRPEQQVKNNKEADDVFMVFTF